MKCPRCQRRLREAAEACLCGWTAGGNSQPAGKRHHDCEAYGCPIPGTISPNLNGTGPWKCFVHDRLNAHDLQQVTAAIRKRLWMFKLLQWLYSMPVIDWKPELIDVLKVRLAELGREDLYPKSDATLGSAAGYASWIVGKIVAECKEESTARVRPETAASKAISVPDFSRAVDLVDVT